MPQSGLNLRIKIIPPNDHFDTKADLSLGLSSDIWTDENQPCVR